MSGSILRPFLSSDIEFAVRQTTREGWDSDTACFQMGHALDPDGSLIAEINGQPVGLVTTTRHDRTAWIGNVIVEPDYRSRGIGRLLTQAAIELIEKQGVETIRLEADPAGIPLYRSLGFVDEFESLRFRLDADAARLRRSQVTRIEPEDLERLIELDTACFGDRRDRLLRAIRKGARATYLAGEHGRGIGYAMATTSRTGVRVGPWIAENEQVAAAVLGQVLGDRAIVGCTLTLGVPVLNERAVVLLEGAGFKTTPSCLRMVRGENGAESRGRAELVYAIANGAMG